MHRGVLLLACLAIGACGERSSSAPPQHPPPSARPPNETAGPSPAQSVAPAPAERAAPSDAEAPLPPPPSSAPLFTYTEGTDKLSFWPPVTLRLERDPRTPCLTELSSGLGGGNMWTGPDVERAFADAEVQALLSRAGKHSFVAEADAAGTIVEGVLAAKNASVAWTLAPCHYCVASPKGVTHLHAVLKGVMLNRRLLCDASK